MHLWSPDLQELMAPQFSNELHYLLTQMHHFVQIYCMMHLSPTTTSPLSHPLADKTDDSVFYAMRLHKASPVYLHSSCPHCQITYMHPISLPGGKDMVCILTVGAVAPDSWVLTRNTTSHLSAPKRKREREREKELERDSVERTPPPRLQQSRYETTLKFTRSTLLLDPHKTCLIIFSSQLFPKNVIFKNTYWILPWLVSHPQTKLRGKPLFLCNLAHKQTHKPANKVDWHSGEYTPPPRPNSPLKFNQAKPNCTRGTGSLNMPTRSINYSQGNQCRERRWQKDPCIRALILIYTRIKAVLPSQIFFA